MRKKMLGTAGILILVFALSMGAAGCAGKGDGEPDILDTQNGTLHDSDGIGSNSEPDSLDSNEIKDSGEVEGNTESVYFEGADLNGRVLEFSDTGFTITPIYREVFEDGTSNSWEAAPGKEKEEDNIYVTYTEDTAFEIVYFNMSLQDVSKRENADKSSIKKQSEVYVFGSSEDGKNWIADKVLIQKWDEDEKKDDGSSSGMPDDSREEGKFYDGADLSGRVVDFSDMGCTITPRTMIINEDGSMEGGIAAPGYESEETNIHITYAEDVVFQIIYFSMAAQAETSREDADKSSIKKETDVNIFGTCQDEKNWIANKVVITRWQ